jgi:hypothetical protein
MRFGVLELIYIRIRVLLVDVAVLSVARRLRNSTAYALEALKFVNFGARDSELS